MGGKELFGQEQTDILMLIKYYILGHYYLFYHNNLGMFFEELDCNEPMNFTGRPCYIIQDQTYLHSVYHRNCTYIILLVLLVFNSIVKIMSSHRIQRRVNIKFFSNKALFKNVLTRHIWHISMPFNLWIFCLFHGYYLGHNFSIL